LILADSIDKTNKTFRAECDILYNSLDAETNNRLTAYNELQSKINAEVVRSGQKDIELEHTLATAIATVNSTIDNRITEESLARETGFAKVNAELDLVHTEVNKKIDNEISSCIDANNSLRNELYKEIADREDAIIKIQEKIGEEANRSVDYTDTKVKTLEDSIIANYYTREIINNFNSELHTNISTEATARATTDDSLDKRITALEREVVLISCGNSKF
jgi:tellurite resistance protein